MYGSANTSKKSCSITRLELSGLLKSEYMYRY